MEIQTLDETITLKIPNGKKKIGVMLSGGADSAILSFLLIKKILDENLSVDFTMYNVPNPVDSAKEHSQNVHEWLNNYYKTNYKLVYIGGTGNSREIINTPAKNLLESNTVDFLFSGQNQFPPEAKNWPLFVESEQAGKFKRRDPAESDSEYASFPFIKLYKTHVMNLYKLFNVLDLLKVTHSCTESRFVCNDCIWCHERNWAIKSLNL